MNNLFYNGEEVVILSYKELYFQLFSAMTEALGDLQNGRIISAMQILLRETQAAEAVHMETDILPEAPLK